MSRSVPCVKSAASHPSPGPVRQHLGGNTSPRGFYTCQSQPVQVGLIAASPAPKINNTLAPTAQLCAQYCSEAGWGLEGGWEKNLEGDETLVHRGGKDLRGEPDLGSLLDKPWMLSLSTSRPPAALVLEQQGCLSPRPTVRHSPGPHTDGPLGWRDSPGGRHVCQRTHRHTRTQTHMLCPSCCPRNLGLVEVPLLLDPREFGADDSS